MGKIKKLNDNENAKLYNYYKGDKLIEHSYTLHAPIKYIKEIFTCIKERAHRAKCGYKLSDVWNIDSWFISIMPHMLNDLLSNMMGYPGTDKFPTYESWVKELEEMKFCFEEANEETCSQQNEFEDADFKNTHFKSIPLEDGCFRLEITYDDEELHNKWAKRDKELDEYRHKMKKKALKMFVDDFDNLWD